MSNDRNRAWRRSVNRLKNSKGTGCKNYWKPEKAWKMMYLRSEKLHRAQQLGFKYPKQTERQLLGENGIE